MPAPSIGHNIINLPFTASSSGDNSIVTPTAKQTLLIYGIDMQGATATAIAIKDGTSNTLVAAGATATSFVRDMLPTCVPRYVCTKGNAFVINLGAANSFSGVLYYAVYQNPDGT